jgi:hypothetical protein
VDGDWPLLSTTDLPIRAPRTGTIMTTKLSVARTPKVGGFIEIADDSDIIPWQFTDPDTKIKAASVFQLRTVPNEIKKQLEFDYTKVEFTRRGKQETFDWQGYVAECLDYCIVGWKGIKRQGEDLPCELEWKTKLPELVKADIIRLCVGRELGQLQSGVKPSQLPEVEADADPS